LRLQRGSGSRDERDCRADRGGQVTYFAASCGGAPISISDTSNAKEPLIGFISARTRLSALS
jgi:hypothetical protein